MNDILCRQLALDYCCSPGDVADNVNHFTIYRPLDGRRRYHGDNDCYLKVAVVNGKLLFSGREEIIGWCRERYEKHGGEWFLEFAEMSRLNERISKDGYMIKFAHAFYISDTVTPAAPTEYRTDWYGRKEIGQFRGDGRFDEAFAFFEDAPHVLAVSASDGDRVLGMAGASYDSPTMWQIGINVDPDTRRSGIGTLLVTLLKNEIIKRGILPFYGTSMSHIASQRTALASGFAPAWAEIAISAAEN